MLARGEHGAHGCHLGLAALVSVVLAAVAVAMAARRHSERHLSGTAVMRCLGAQQRTLVGIHVGELVLLGLAACTVGVLIAFGLQWGIGPALRLRPDGGHGPWFVEGGMGASYASPRFATRYKEMSTRLNFVSHLAVGFNHGEEHQHEWQLRLQHSPNGGIKKPNPEQNYLQLRDALHF